MKKSSTRNDADLKKEYHLDYSKAKPNRFAKRFAAESRVVVLDPDIAKVFTSQRQVNAVLRALISTMPKANAKG